MAEIFILEAANTAWLQRLAGQHIDQEKYELASHGDDVSHGDNPNIIGHIAKEQFSRGNEEHQRYETAHKAGPDDALGAQGGSQVIALHEQQDLEVKNL